MSNASSQKSPVVMIAKLSNKELRQHTLLQQQKSGIPMASSLMKHDDDQRSVDSSTGAAYQVPIQNHNSSATTGTTNTTNLVDARELLLNHNHHTMNTMNHNRMTTPSSMRSYHSDGGRLSVISDVKAELYDCDDDDDDIDGGANIGKTEDDDSPMSTPQNSAGSNVATTTTASTRMNKKQKRGKRTKRGGSRGGGASSTSSPQPYPDDNDDLFWKQPNVRYLACFIILLLLVVTIAIVVVVVLTKPSRNSSSTTGSSSSAGDGPVVLGNVNGSTTTSGGTTSPNTSPTTGGSGGPIQSLPPLYNDDMMEYIQQTLMDITAGTTRALVVDDTTTSTTENGSAVWNDPTSSQVLARDWILYQDTYLVAQRQLPPYNSDTTTTTLPPMDTSTTTTTPVTWMDRLLQRYALVQLYYATNGVYWDTSNSTTITNNQFDFVNATSSECTWTGVNCDDTKRRRYLQYVQQQRNSLDRMTNSINNNINNNDHPRLLSTAAAAILSHIDGMNTMESPMMTTTMMMMSRMMQDDTSNFYGMDETMNKVFRLYFQGRNLTGTIPNELGRCIPRLKELDLSRNSLVGTIPYTLFTPDTVWDKTLTWLDVSSNALIGSIPSNIWTLQELRFLFVNDNNLTGHIERMLNDTTIVSTENDDEDDSSSGSISNDTNGTMATDDDITDQVGEKRSLLKQIQLHKNQLSGSIPNWFNELSDLEQFIAYNNELTGPLPDPIPGSLIVFDVSYNSISGTIPIKLWSESDSPTKIERMYLDHNRLSGTIPNSTQLRQDMQRLWLDNNYLLTGTIPENFGYAWSRLSELQLHRTNLTGQLGPVIDSDDDTDVDMGGINISAATDVCQLTWPNLTILKADCFQRARTDVPPVFCECCTLCESTAAARVRRKQANIKALT